MLSYKLRLQLSCLHHNLSAHQALVNFWKCQSTMHCTPGGTVYRLSRLMTDTSLLCTTLLQGLHGGSALSEPPLRFQCALHRCCFCCIQKHKNHPTPTLRWCCLLHQHQGVWLRLREGRHSQTGQLTCKCCIFGKVKRPPAGHSSISSSSSVLEDT